jgi:very-short-patch-repair endonuclease
MNPLDPSAILSIFMMTFLKYGVPAFTICAALSYLSAKVKKRKRRRWPALHIAPPKTALADLKLTARRPLTASEEKMFLALTDALPQCTVLAQVSFQALLDTPQPADRNRFDRKYADFVICSKRLTPIAVVELDDPSHLAKQEQDADRDAMLQNAGYQTIRYNKIPLAPQIQLDIENALRKLTSN